MKLFTLILTEYHISQPLTAYVITLRSAPSVSKFPNPLQPRTVHRTNANPNQLYLCGPIAKATNSFVPALRSMALKFLSTISKLPKMRMPQHKPSEPRTGLCLRPLRALHLPRPYPDPNRFLPISGRGETAAFSPIMIGPMSLPHHHYRLQAYPPFPVRIFPIRFSMVNQMDPSL